MAVGERQDYGKTKGSPRKILRGICETVLVPTVTYESETWVRNICDKSHVRSQRIRVLTKVKMRLRYKVQQSVRKLYSHIMRMEEGRCVRKINELRMPGVRKRSR